MERTAGLEMPAGSFQGNVLRDDLDDIVGRADLLNNMVFVTRSGIFLLHNASFAYPPTLCDSNVFFRVGL